MKNLTIPSLLVFVNFNLYCQDIDSLKRKILKMDVAINNLHLNMRESHAEFKSGTILIIAGVATTILGISLNTTNNNNNNTIPIIGTSLSAIGTILQIDSHKYLGRGGRRKKSKSLDY